MVNIVTFLISNKYRGRFKRIKIKSTISSEQVSLFACFFSLLATIFRI